jgi:hypothetical protein
MKTRPMDSVADIAADARQMLARARAHAKAFAKADAGRKKKLLDAAWMRGFEDAIRGLEKAVAAQTTGKGVVVVATSAEVKLRAQLFDALATIRDDIKLSYPDDRALGRAFGVGQRVTAKLTGPLLTAAAAIEDAYAGPHKRTAADAGITPARVAMVAKLRIALAKADTDQNERLSARKGATVAKNEVLDRVRKGAAHVRTVAKHVFRGDKKALAEFTSTLPRRNAKKRTMSAAVQSPQSSRAPSPVASESPASA